MATELFEMNRDDRIKRLKMMDTGRLLAELDDTIQLDMMKMSNEQWLTCTSKKAYADIVRELRERMNT